MKEQSEVAYQERCDYVIEIKIPGHLFTLDLQSIKIVRKRGEAFIRGYKLEYKKWWEIWK